MCLVINARAGAVWLGPVYEANYNITILIVWCSFEPTGCLIKVLVDLWTWMDYDTMGLWSQVFSPPLNHFLSNILYFSCFTIFDVSISMHCAGQTSRPKTWPGHFFFWLSHVVLYWEMLTVALKKFWLGGSLTSWSPGPEPTYGLGTLIPMKGTFNAPTHGIMQATVSVSASNLCLELGGLYSCHS